MHNQHNLCKTEPKRKLKALFFSWLGMGALILLILEVLIVPQVLVQQDREIIRFNRSKLFNRFKSLTGLRKVDMFDSLMGLKKFKQVLTLRQWPWAMLQ